MSRQLFRGRVVARVRKHPEEYHDFGWKYGDLHHYYNGSYFTHITEIVADEMETITHDVVSYSVGQCTGLKDKNGKLIFEGDVLQYSKHEGYSLPSFLAYVVWSDSCACFGYNRHNAPDWAIPIPFNRHDELQEDFLNHCEIVGNDYENKEMLAKFKQRKITIGGNDDLPF